MENCRLTTVNSQLPLRIALVHVADKGGGAERSVLTLHQSLLAEGHDCRLFVGRKLLDELGVIEIQRHRSIPGLLRITKHLEEWGVQNLYAPWFRNLPDAIGDVDVVHLHSLWTVRNVFADLSGIKTISDRYPTVMTLRDGWMLTGHCACPIGCDRWKTGCGSCPDLARAPGIEKDFTAFNWKRKRSTIQRSSLHITAVSSWLRQQIQQSPIFAGKPVHVVHNSVDDTGFQPGDKAAARAALQIPLDQFVVLLAGQSIEGFHQGISQHAVKALNQLNDHGIHTMLIGRSAGDVARTLQTPSTMVPYRETPEEMAQCFQAADLTIVPSEYETFGRVAAESLFCGTPVLAFATGGLSDIVIDGVNGKLVPTGDVDGMATAIAELRHSSDFLSDMASRCYESVRHRFSTRTIASEYEDVYRQVISERTSNQVAHRVTTPPRVQQTSDVSSPEPAIGFASPKISCIIPAYNCELWLKRAVDSVLATAYEPIEILVIDDGSSDNTLQVADQLATEYPQKVRVLQHSDRRNHGVSAARNLGLKHCTGEWICFLDADDYVYPHRFDSAVQILGSQSDVDGVHQLAEMVFPTEEASERWWKNSPYFGFEHPIAPNDLLSQLLKGQCWATSAIIFRKHLLERSGLFNEQLAIAEDCHLWFRMAAVGNLVSGDLTRPVSAYWRRLDSAYQPTASQRLPMIRSMASFLTWLNGAKTDPAINKTAKNAVCQYVLQGLTNARFEKENKLAWSIAVEGIRRIPSLSFDQAFLGQVARLMAGR
jgi:glycosyltransferase involved in cell wall biosynthesis